MPQSDLPRPTGRLITVEGGEGSGKTTVAAQLAERLRLQGHEVLLTREPGGSPLAEQIRHLLLEAAASHTIGERAELLLFLAARAQHVEAVLLPALRAGKLVLCDRFNDSSIAYQGEARGLGTAYVEQLCHLATGGLEPSYTLLLDLDPLVGLQRIQASRSGAVDRMEQEPLAFHQAVRRGYRYLADRYPDRITVIDAARPLALVVEEAFTALVRHLTAGTPLV